MDTPSRRPSAGLSRACVSVALALAMLSPGLRAQEELRQPANAESAEAAVLGQVHEYRIAARDLAGALDQLAQQSGLQIIYDAALVEGRQAEALEGRHSVGQAMSQLLSDSGLRWAVVNGNTLVLGAGPDEDDHSAIDITPAPGGTTSVEIAQRGGLEEIIVTGQKKAERLQDVPIAISAFSMEDLDAQKLEGGFDLLKAIPNVTFSKTNFTGYNFQIRGIGTQAVSAATDPGVAVSFNNTALIVNRLFEQEYLDIERVEVLRGPQGTLYGRNATSGVINVISAKPAIGEEFGEIKLEGGNFSAQRLRGHYNIPLGDTLALRAAYAMTQRDGYGFNQAAADFANVRSDVDDRDLWTGRLSLGWEPTERLRVNLLWERFEEDDQRVRSAKQLCHRDEGLTDIGGYDVLANPEFQAIQRIANQGCLPKSLYDRGAFDTPNGDAIPFVSGARENGLFLISAFPGPIGFNPNFGNPDVCFEGRRDQYWSLVDQCVDVFANRNQPRDLRTIYSRIEPVYRADSDIFELSLDYHLSDTLVLSSQTVYVDDDLYSTQDFNRFEISPGLFNDISGPGVDPIYADFAPGGIYCDPQLGCSDSLLIQDVSQATSQQFNQEIRLVSSFASDFNFSFGANYTRFKTLNEYYVFSNLLSALAQTAPFDGPGGVSPTCTSTGGERGCIYIDPNELSEINGDGHNYFRSSNPYQLDSAALFGELYWQISDTVKLTAGLRYTWDQKVFTPIPSQTLLPDYREGGAFNQGLIKEGDPPEACTILGYQCGIVGNAPGGRGYPADPDIVQTWREPTGRIVVDWKPTLPFTDETLLYASYSRGYKGGGANPPGIAAPAGIFIAAAQGAVAPRTFNPEYVNAYEIGTKNALFNGMLIVNGAAFMYDYKDYQISKIVDRSAANENFDAEIWGFELETIFAPSYDWQFNAALGFLSTEVGQGERSIDLMDRTQGGNQSFTTADGRTYDEWVLLKPNPTQTSNCVVPAELVRSALENGTTFGGQPVPPSLIGTSMILTAFCPAGNIIGGNYTGIAAPGATDTFGLVTGETFNATTDAPNGGAGFFADVSGNELPNSPRFTAAVGAQYSFDMGSAWRTTVRMDHYIQGKSFARIYNTEYDRLKSWQNTNLSVWTSNEQWGVTVEGYVKNLFDETPITGTFLNSDDTGLTTNIYTLDPRLVGVSITKQF